MKKRILTMILALLLTSCSGWVIQPLPGPTPFLPPTFTPSVFTATPVIIGVPSLSPTPVVAAFTLTPSATPFPTSTNFSTPISSDTQTTTQTQTPTGPGISIKVLGCNTSIDITHGMGEVTNAFVTLMNTGGVELTNLKATLYALDEGRVHPDKTVELNSLPVGYEVTVKLTVDSTYKQETPIQVEVTSDQQLFPREGLPSCKDIGVLVPNPDGLKTPVPANP